MLVLGLGPSFGMDGWDGRMGWEGWMDRPDAWDGWKELMDGWTGRDGVINGGGGVYHSAHLLLSSWCFIFQSGVGDELLLILNGWVGGA